MNVQRRVTQAEAQAAEARLTPGSARDPVHRVRGRADWHGTLSAWLYRANQLDRRALGFQMTTRQAAAVLVVEGHSVAVREFGDRPEIVAALAILPEIPPAFDGPDVRAWRERLQEAGGEALASFAWSDLLAQPVETWPDAALEVYAGLFDYVARDLDAHDRARVVRLAQAGDLDGALAVLRAAADPFHEAWAALGLEREADPLEELEKIENLLGHLAQREE
jgi:hypothetical protein